MKKNLSLIIRLIAISSFNTNCMDISPKQTQCDMPQAAGIQYTRNNFGDIFPQWHNISHEKLSTQLALFVDQLKNKFPETPFIVEVPHEKAAAINLIKKAGFSFYAANNDKSEWIYKNNSSIPAPYTTSIGSGVCIRKDDTILVIEEKTRRGYIGFPGGTADEKEDLRAAAVRELKEEVNLDINPNDLTLFALINRVNINRFHANGTDHHYVIDYSKVAGDLKPISSEIVQLFYAPLEDIAKQIPINGLLVDPAMAAQAQHLLNKNSHSHHEIFLDYRQFFKKESERNHDDTMTIEFFAQ